MQRIDSSVRTLWAEQGQTPAAEVDSGEEFWVESASFTEGYSFENMHALEIEQAVTPLTAPIVVRTAEPGDVLKVEVLDLQFLRDFGCILLLPGRGAFPDVVTEMVAKAIPINDSFVTFSPEIRLPTSKMLGKVSVAPAVGRVLSNEPGSHGGNMDNKAIGIGSTVYLPVNVPGAHLGVGDAHALQGDGECGISAVEVEMRSRLRVSVIKGTQINVPIVMSDGYLMTMGTGESLDEAAREALNEMSRLVQGQLKLTPAEAAMLMSIGSDVHVSQMVNPRLGVKVRIPTTLIPGI